MKIQLLDEKKSPLLGRSRYKFQIEYLGESTPSNTDVKKEVARILKVKDELIAIRHIYQRFGVNKSKVIVHVYEKESDLRKLEKDSKASAKAEEKKEAKQEEASEAVNEG
jgi:ribosomal protein S24E